MPSEYTQPGKFDTFISSLENGLRPVERHIGRSLREIYTPGVFRSAYVNGDMQVDEKGMVIDKMISKGIVFMSLQDDIIRTRMLTTEMKGRRQEVLVAKMEKTLNKIPADAGFLQIFETAALQTLIKNDVQTVAAISVNTNINQNQELIIVHYPLAYSHVLDYVDPLISSLIPELFHSQDLPLILAASFLKSRSLKKTSVQFNLP